MKGKANRDAAYVRWHELCRNPVSQPLVTSDSAVGLIDVYLDWLQKNRAQGTYKIYLRHLETFCQHIGIELTAAELKPKHITAWLDKADWSDSTKAGAVQTVRTAFHWLVRDGHLNHATMALWRQEDRDRIVGAGGQAEVGGKIHCLDAATGEPQWTLDHQVLSHGRGLGPGGISIYGDIMLAYIREGVEKEPDAQFCTAWRINGSTPELLWRVNADQPKREHVPVIVNKRFVFTGDLKTIDIETGKVADQANGIRPENGGYLQAMEDLVLVRRYGTHGKIETTHYRASDEGKINCINPNQQWTPPFGGTTTSYHHPIMYPLVDGRMFLRQYDGEYCWNLRKAKHGE